MKCVIESYAVSVEPYGSAKTMSMCRTHNWALDLSYPINTEYLCPIGRIEEARDAALEAIKKAKDE